MNNTAPTHPPASAEHLAAAFAAVVVAMAAIKPDTREQAHALHTGYLRSQGVPDVDIADHWATFGGKYIG